MVRETRTKAKKTKLWQRHTNKKQKEKRGKKQNVVGGSATN
jgi:hypothetical protein